MTGEAAASRAEPQTQRSLSGGTGTGQAVNQAGTAFILSMVQGEGLSMVQGQGLPRDAAARIN